jgi:hypothetical protein
MPRKTKKPPQPTKAKKRKTRPSGDAWPASALGRRQVLKGLVAGSSVVASAMSLPKEWTKPVVQSIVASAQAQVSPPQGMPVPIPFNPLFVPVPIPVPVTPRAPVVPTIPFNPLFVPVPIPVPVPVIFPS